MQEKPNQLQKLPTIPKRPKLQNLLLFFVLALWPAFAAHAQQAGQFWPRLRHIDPALKLPESLPTTNLRLLVMDDFAPYSFKAASGQWVGFSVDLATEACAELKLTCQFVEVGFADLVPALQRGDGHVIVSGLRMTQELADKVNPTRPYYMSSGRFVTRAGTRLENAETRSVAGKRLGFVKDTTLGKFIETYYQVSELVPFKNEMEMFEALRTGGIELTFSDSMRAAYWIKGSQSRNCCEALGPAYYDRYTFAAGLSFMLQKDRNDLRQAFDFALDQLERRGKTSEIIARYIPPAMW
jgi:polar amino acid transport system substrate-binding protein